jgi:DNA-binding NarL/FixJ family response regulator
LSRRSPWSASIGPGSPTTREREVLRSLAFGETNDDIAATLFISPLTVQRNTRDILGKLGVHSNCKRSPSLPRRRTDPLKLA